ncbi:class I SAM-dependent methyltransferase [Fusobacterium ulcerans]|uniref:class I SAM-dependent methyltransferase n=1 Tax=Fusobacterium ulcerans TaxID=861 RepID=UPI002E76FBE5|nr:class I SAM-dependent methyltransferase [Fusobacterium ulcerans]MEE0139668.1 class I SAM-dependent methyltransferase [Fusobacterium ulcerans]
MKENKYDDEIFFEKYSQMDRSKKGLAGAGEWHELKKMLPDFKGKKVLDLGCGFGWHCIYAMEQGADSAVGIDISSKMLEEAKKKTKFSNVEYIQMPIEDINFEADSFDVVISSLAFHYVESFENICKKVNNCLVKGGEFIFSAEHPVFTAQGREDWYCDESGNILHWPVDSYYLEGKRESVFLGEKVVKYHKTLTTYLNTLLKTGFEITGIVEAQPSEEMLKIIPEMKDELRRPMMLLVSAKKK